MTWFRGYKFICVYEERTYLYCHHHRRYEEFPTWLGCINKRRSKQGKYKLYIKESDMRKPEQSPTKAKGKTEANDEQFAKKFPTLLEFMTTTEWEGGEERETSTLTIFVEDGAFKVAVNDRALKQSVYMTGKTLQDALGATERALAGGMADWRAWSGKKRK